MAKSVVSDAVSAAVCRLYSGGRSSGWIATEVGISGFMVLKILADCGVKKRPRGRYNARANADATLLAKLYAAGESPTKLSRDYGMDRSSMRNLLRRYGNPIRGRREASTRYVHDPSPFEEYPISDEAAYFAGLLLTDGCLKKNDYGRDVVQISLTESDAGILEQLRLFLKYTGPLTTEKGGRICPLNGSIQKPMKKLLITSDRLGVAVRRLGVVPRKTTIAMASDDLAMRPDFWRGAVDGDGWMCRGRGEIGLCSASRILIDQFRDFCRSYLCRSVAKVSVARDRSCKVPLYRMRYSATQAKAIIEILYDRPGPAIGRKRLLAAEILRRPLSAN